MIDPHVHCRDWSQSYKETIRHALLVAGRIGLSGIFDMPNTSPPVDSREMIEKRLADAAKIKSNVFYGIYAGLTSDRNQIRQVVNSWRELFPKVVGLKMFAGHSVGNLGIVEEEKQKLVYQTLAAEGYDGVLAVHCEKESFLKPGLWNPLNPKSHSFARPPKSEIESISDQINFAQVSKFKGVLHIAHVSVPESINLIERARKQKKIRISCGLTPHHCLLNYNLIPETPRGLLYKVNPPLRNKTSSKMMLASLKEGKIDWIETDHAPHTLKEKIRGPFMSGFPGLPFYPHFLEFLKSHGFSGEQIGNLTHKNVCNTFGIDLPELSKTPDFGLEKQYEVDVYRGKR